MKAARRFDFTLSILAILATLLEWPDPQAPIRSLIDAQPLGPSLYWMTKVAVQVGETPYPAGSPDTTVIVYSPVPLKFLLCRLRSQLFPKNTNSFPLCLHCKSYVPMGQERQLSWNYAPSLGVFVATPHAPGPV